MLRSRPLPTPMRPRPVAIAILTPAFCTAQTASAFSFGTRSQLPGRSVPSIIIASKIAAHAADIAKGVPGAMDWDYKMDKARKVLDWEAMFDVAIDPEKARAYRASSKPEKEDTCSMCGNFCAVKNMNKIMEGEIVSIFDE